MSSNALQQFRTHIKLERPSIPAATRGLIDVAIWLAATPLAFWLRYDGLPAQGFDAVVLMTVGLVALKFIVAHLTGFFRRSWSKFAFRDALRLTQVVAIPAFFATLVLLVFGAELGIARSLGLIDGLVTLSMMVGARGFVRFWFENSQTQRVQPDKRKNVLVLGAGEAGSLVVREMLRHPETGLHPVGFLDDDARKVGHRIASIPVLDTITNLKGVLEKHHVDQVLIAMPSADGKTIRSIVDNIVSTKPNVKYRIVPGIYELISGQVSISRLREVEIEDLLRRPPVKLDTEKILGYLEGKVVMITGAGGSIGSELVRQICRFRPKELILFGHGENSIYNLERELDRNWPEIRYHSVIGAIQNGARLDYIFRRYKPQVIFHSAAHKHVPLMETNPEEAVFNNIIGSKNLVSLALKHGISHFVNISTDKAVNPSSVMGASKRVVEYIVQEAARQANPEQVFVSVRFGNVLGSRGSVIPLFKEQIRNGGPVTVTHPDMIRYFMTIPEAAQLVLQASGQGKNGEIYILDMGEPVKIVDLARDLIRLSGFKPDEDIPIKFTGMRPGEKLFEELMTDDEKGSVTSHDKIFVAKCAKFDPDELQQVVLELQQAALRSDGTAIRELFAGFLKESHLPVTKEPAPAEISSEVMVPPVAEPVQASHHHKAK